MLLHREGRGFVNSLIERLPFEIHLPGYNCCGPGTKLQKRLARGDRGINPLDEACKEHDIAYSLNKDLNERHKADLLLQNAANDRVRSRDATASEKISAWLIGKTMGTKRKFGMEMKKTTPLKKVIKRAKHALRKQKTFGNIYSTSKIALNAAKLGTPFTKKLNTRELYLYQKQVVYCLLFQYLQDCRP